MYQIQHIPQACSASCGMLILLDPNRYLFIRSEILHGNDADQPGKTCQQDKGEPFDKCHHDHAPFPS